MRQSRGRTEMGNRTMPHRFARTSLCTLAVLLLLLQASPPGRAYAAASTDHAIVFLLDASNSMNSNDRERLAKDSIAQMVHSLPSNYLAGFAAYSTQVLTRIPPQDSGRREAVVEAVNAVPYAGYTNAGAGLAAALELLEGTAAGEKAVVMLSDGEIVMGSAGATAESAARFQAAVEAAQAAGVRIHVIGLGPDMAEGDNAILSAAAQTGGGSYRAPQAADLQGASDAILLERLGVKRTRAALIDSGGGEEAVSIALPFPDAGRVRILLTGSGPMENLRADFSAEDGRQYAGSRYALLELDRPAGDRVGLSFRCRSAGQVRVDVISEYALIARPEVFYSDGEGGGRTAEISIAFYDAERQDRPMLTGAAFQDAPVSVSASAAGMPVACPLRDGTLSFRREAAADEELALRLDMGGLDANVTVAQPVPVALEGPPPAQPAAPADYRPHIIAGALALLAALFFFLVSRRRRPRAAVPQARAQGEGRFSYTGRLNIYILRSGSGRDFPPLTYNLFPIPGGRTLSLGEVLDSCGVDEPFEGAAQITFRPGAGRCLLLTNGSDCTLMQNRELLMKGRSYQISLNSKVDITFEDERSELALQYREVKPSGMRLPAGAAR